MHNLNCTAIELNKEGTIVLYFVVQRAAEPGLPRFALGAKVALVQMMSSSSTSYLLLPDYAIHRIGLPVDSDTTYCLKTSFHAIKVESRITVSFDRHKK